LLGVAMSVTIRRPYVLALLAATATVIGVGVAQRADVRHGMGQLARSAARQHLSSYSKGFGYELLDDRFYADRRPVEQRLDTMTRGEAIRFVARGAASYVLVPLPWQATSWARIAYQPVQVFWYALFGLAVLGLSAALRRDTLVTSLLVCSGGVIAAGISVTEGNIGTLIRHRDLATLLFLWISAVGAVRVIARLHRSPSRDASLEVVTDLPIASWHVPGLAWVAGAVLTRTIALEDWQCVRLAGWILFVSVAIESMLVPAGGAYEWPTTLAVRGGLAAIALSLIVGSRGVRVPWSGRASLLHSGGEGLN
jgi:hypothetical protein